MQQVKLEYSSSNLSAKQCYDQMRLLYPQEQVFVAKFTDCKNKVHYHPNDDTKCKLPRNEAEREMIFEESKYGLTYWSRKQVEATVSSSTESNDSIFTKYQIYHQKQVFERIDAEYFTVRQQLNEKLRLQTKLRSQILTKGLAQEYFGSVYLGRIAAGSHIFGMQIGQMMLSETVKWLIDGTFPVIYQSPLSRLYGGVFKPYPLIVFITGYFEAPTLAHSSKTLLGACFLMKHKTKKEYAAACRVFKEKSSCNFSYCLCPKTHHCVYDA